MTLEESLKRLDDVEAKLKKLIAEFEGMQKILTAIGQGFRGMGMLSRQAANTILKD